MAGNFKANYAGDSLSIRRAPENPPAHLMES